MPKRSKQNLGSLPRWIAPQLCELVKQPPEGERWVHEIKYDGYRMHARIEGGRARLLTRTGLDWSAKYPAAIAALQTLVVRQAYIDGELWRVRPAGITSVA